MTSGMLAKGVLHRKRQENFHYDFKYGKGSIGFRVFGFSASKGFSLLVLSLLGQAPSTKTKPQTYHGALYNPGSRKSDNSFIRKP